MLSVIIPAYNEQDNAPAAAAAISRTLSEADIPYELIFINDGSTDKTWLRLVQLTKSDECIKAISLSRNFGKEAAIFAGLENASGDACAVIDCDLQHPPGTLIEMYRIWEGGAVDIIEGKKRTRGSESAAYGRCAKFFYRILNRLSGMELDDSSDFRLLDRSAVEALLDMPERLTFFRAMSNWVGFNTKEVYFDVAERNSGESKFTVRSLVKYAVTSITSFTSAPLNLVTWAGVITFIIALIFGITTFIQKLSGRSAEGFPTVILLLLITSAIIMFSLGIIGYYLSRIYEEIKRRPRYIIKRRIGFRDENKGE